MAKLFQIVNFKHSSALLKFFVCLMLSGMVDSSIIYKAKVSTRKG